MASSDGRVSLLRLVRDVSHYDDVAGWSLNLVCQWKAAHGSRFVPDLKTAFFILFPIKPFFNPRIGFWTSLRLIDGLKEASVRKNIFSRLQIYFQMAAPIPDEGVFELCKKQ